MDLLAPLIKNIIAPLWWLRDGDMRFSYLKNLEKSQWLTLVELQTQQLTKLKKLLIHAHNTVPYYTEIFKLAGFDPNTISSLGDLARLPILSKSAIIDHKDRLISSDFNKQDMTPACTGGSTGTQLHFYIDEESNRMKNACAWRHNRWAGWDIGTRVAAVWGNPKQPSTLKTKLRAALLARYAYLDTMRMTNDSMSAFAHKLKHWMPCVLYGHAHSIYLLAEFLKDAKLRVPTPRGIVVTSMMLIPQERQVIEQVLGCKVTNRYGCEEVSLIASECAEHNGMHLNLDHLVVEFIKEDGLAARPGEDGRIVVTDLTNFGMPFIRYAVGDVGVPSARICPCGRGLPLMERLSGRMADFLIRMDGSKVAGVSLVERLLTNILGIRQMQIVQNEKQRLCFRIVKNSDFSAELSEQNLQTEFADIFPGSAMYIEYVFAIPQEQNGKYRFAICNVQ